MQPDQVNWIVSIAAVVLYLGALCVIKANCPETWKKCWACISVSLCLCNLFICVYNCFLKPSGEQDIQYFDPGLTDSAALAREPPDSECGYLVISDQAQSEPA
mmetsp:Transcript_99858/g.311085  ORF Transcript_99858/g.311085 Transcript_99858/m.311085 type:complete len:103 (-) Transcript_99858:91-399(-)